MSNEKPEPNAINIYAGDVRITHTDRISAQGFGTSTKLDTPVEGTRYRWKGRLHDSESGVESYNTHDDLGKLAANLALNMGNHTSKLHREAGVPEYAVSYELPEGKAELGIPEETPRNLTPEEKQRFEKELRANGIDESKCRFPQSE